MTSKLVTLTALAALSLAPAVAFAQSPNPESSTPPAVAPHTPGTATPDAASPNAPASVMPKDTTAATTTMPTATPKFVSAQASGQWMASDLIGSDVVTSSDEKLGSISDAVVDPEGNVLAAVIDVGGFLGIGAKPVAVSFDSLTATPTDDGQKIVVALTKEELNAAPEFKTLDQARDESASNAPKTQ